MASSGAVTLSLTLMINKEKTKVLFASVDSAFADVLLSFLTLPLGRILKLLVSHSGGDKAPTIGSLKTLYNGLQNLDSDYFWKEVGRQMLLDPRSSLDDECSKLKINISGSQPTKYFGCACSPTTPSVSVYAGASCTNCGNMYYKEIKLRDAASPAPPAAAVVNAEVFTKEATSFIISDDLQMLPNVPSGSFITTMKHLGIMDMRGAEPKIVTVGFKEIMDLLRVSLFSSSPLTDLFLHNGQIHHPAKEKSQFSLSPLFSQDARSSSKKMQIKVMMQKSTKKFLFAEAGGSFVDFLFSFLTIPLGQVERLLNMNASLGSIDNLYASFAKIDGYQCLTMKDCVVNMKDYLLNPKLSAGYLSDKQLFSLEEEATPKIFYHHNTKLQDYQNPSYWSTNYPRFVVLTFQVRSALFVDPKGQGSYIKESGMFMVMDDLTVKPLHMFSSLSTLVGMEIPLTDIEELKIDVGLVEALNILKASLASTSALTNGLKLNEAVTLKQPKQER